MKTTVTQIKINRFDSYRGADEIVIFTKGEQTGTNPYGLEAVVQRGTVIKTGSNNNIIPEDGLVVSGHGKGADFIRKNVIVGAKIEIDTENSSLLVSVDSKALELHYKAKIDEIQKREKASGESADMLMTKAREALAKKDYKTLDDLLEEAYYITASAKEGEIRGIWHRPQERSPQAIDSCVKRLADAGINIILIETIFEGYSVASRCTYLPLRDDLKDKDFDLVDEFIKAGKKYGVQIHAWIENFFVGIKSKKEGTCGSPIIDEKPHWAARKKDGTIFMDSEPGFIYLNAALPEVRVFLRDMYKTLLDEYEFDGIQLDYIRYPLSPAVDESVGFDEYSVAQFKETTGIDIMKVEDVNTPEWKAFVDWKASNITIYVKMMYDLINSYKEAGRDLVLSMAVFGDPEEALRLKSQDWRLWCDNGWLDQIYPMAYLNYAGDVYNEIKHMVDNYGHIPNISGIAPMFMRLPVIESTKQVEACRAAGAVGVSFFATDHFSDLQIEKLKTGVFRK